MLNAIGTRGRRGVRVSINSAESHHEPTSCCACFDRGACGAGTRNAGCGARPSSSGPPEVRTETEPGRKDQDQRPLLAALPLLSVRRQHLRVRLLAFGGEAVGGRHDEICTLCLVDRLPSADRPAPISGPTHLRPLAPSLARPAAFVACRPVQRNVHCGK
jgi:hypothetical protein